MKPAGGRRRWWGRGAHGPPQPRLVDRDAVRAVSLTTARREALLAEQAYEEGVRAAQDRLTRAGEDPLVQELDG